jgi:hypothetical protein
LANSGIYWIDVAYDFCVILLIDTAKLLDITYEEINVWLFVVIWPIISLVLLAEVVRLRLIIKNQ